eukprot:4972236-Pyramimonas_sp.AAC.1
MVAPPRHVCAGRESSGRRPAPPRSRVSRQSSLNALATSKESSAAPGSRSSAVAAMRAVHQLDA